MSDSKVTVPCPGCSKQLRIPVSADGRRIDCPSCQLPFKLQLNRIPTPAIEGDPLALDPDPLGLSSSPVNLGNAAPFQKKKSPSRRDAFKKAKKKSNAEVSEFSSNMVSFGFTLILIAILATVLPLMGLQIRRLRRAGEYAPLVGMFLGLIGSGLITFGWKEKGPAVSGGTGAACALLVVIVGLVGFNMERAQNGGNGQLGARGQGVSQAEIDRRVAEQRDALLGNKNQKSFDENKQLPIMFPNNPSENKNVSPPAVPPASFEDSRKKMEEMINQRMNRRKKAQNNGFGDGSPESKNEQKGNPPSSANPFSFGDNQTDPGTNFGNPPPRMGNPFGANGARSRANQSEPNPFKSEGSPASSIQASDFFDMRRRANEIGVSLMRFRARGIDGLSKSYIFPKLIGTENTFGKIYFANGEPIQGMVLNTSRRMTATLVPLLPSDTKYTDAIYAEDGYALYGVNCCMVAGKIVGLQGIFAGEKSPRLDLDKIKKGPWVGQEPDDQSEVQTTKTTGRPVYGFVVFGTNDIDGFQLITKR